LIVRAVTGGTVLCAGRRKRQLAQTGVYGSLRETLMQAEPRADLSTFVNMGWNHATRDVNRLSRRCLIEI
jgi:hypothetical protein